MPGTVVGAENGAPTSRYAPLLRELIDQLRRQITANHILNFSRDHKHAEKFRVLRESPYLRR